MQGVGSSGSNQPPPAASGAAAAAAAAIVPQSSSSASLSDRSFEVVRGKQDHYRVLHELDRETAARIERQTGLPISFPMGLAKLGVVTTWDEDPKGRLCLGQGASGVFCLGLAEHSDRFVGLKFSRRQADTEKESAFHARLKGVSGVLQSIEVAKGESRAAQVIELAGLGSLAKLKGALQELTNSAMQEQLLYHIARGLLKALDRLHGESAYHLDIKPDNVVIDHHGKVLLIDFDCAMNSDDGMINVLEASGDSHYDAPERAYACWGGFMARAQCSGAKLDAWSAGMLLLELVSDTLLDPREVSWVLNGELEKFSPDLQAILKQAESAADEQRLEAFYRHRLPIPETEFGNVIQGLLTFDPANRALPRESLKHPWFDRLEREVRSGRSTHHLREMVQEVMLAREKDALSPQSLPRPGLNHVHRMELQADLTERLIGAASWVSKTGGPTRTSLLFLCGPPGSGKSHLAQFLISQRSVRSQYGPILWFRSCDSAASLKRQWVAVAQELGLVGPEATFSEAGELLRNWCESRPLPVLMVYDQAGPVQQAVMDGLLNFRGAVLVTTNHEYGPAGPSIDVSSFTDEEARQFVDSYLQRTDPDAGLLCEKLLCSPLALSQACAYIHNRSVSIREYIELLDQDPLLDADEKQMGYQRLSYSIRRMYELAFEHLADALPLLQRLACLSSEHTISSEVADLAVEAGVSTTALERCERWQILSRPSPGTLCMHRPAAKALIGSMSSAEKTVAFEGVSQFLLDRYAKDPHTLPQLCGNRHFLHHAESFLELCRHLEAPSEQLKPLVAQLLRAVLIEIQRSGEFVKSEPLIAELELRARDVWRDEPLRLAAYLSTIGSAWLSRECLDLSESAHEEAGRLYAENGGTAKHRIISLNNRGNIAEKKEKQEIAESLYREASALARRELGEEDLLTLSCLSNLGGVVAAEEAVEIMEKVVLSYSKNAERAPSATMRAMNTYANALSAAGRKEDAHLQRTRCLERLRIIFGNEHPDVAHLLVNLGKSEQKKGNPLVARKRYQEALVIYVHRYGPSHPKTVATERLLEELSEVQSSPLTPHSWRYLRNRVRGKQPDLKMSLDREAARLSYDGLSGSIDTHSYSGLLDRPSPPADRDQEVWRARFKQCIREGRRDHAERIACGSLSTIRRDLGRDHLSAAEWLLRLAQVQELRGHRGVALESLRECYDIRLQKLDSNDPLVIEIRGELGIALESAGLFEEAVVHHEGVLQSLQGYVDRRRLAKALSNLGIALCSAGRAEEALPIHCRALSLRCEQHAGAWHQEIASSEQKLGETHLALGSVDTALHRFERVLAARREHLGERHLETAESWTSLGNVYRILKRFEESLDALEKAEEIVRRSWGSRFEKWPHLFYFEYPSILFDRGRLFYAQKQFPQALDCFDRNLEDFHQDTPARVRLALRNRYYSGRCQEALGKGQEAEQCYQAVLSWLQEHPDPLAEAVRVKCEARMQGVASPTPTMGGAAAAAAAAPVARRQRAGAFSRVAPPPGA